MAVIVVNSGRREQPRGPPRRSRSSSPTVGIRWKDGLVASLNRPGANVTGVSFLASNLGGKKLELIRSVLPGAKAIAALESADSPASQAERVEVLTAARAAGQRVIVLTARTDRDFDSAFATLARERAAGLLVTGDALFASRRDRLVALAARYAVPTIHPDKPFVEAGGLMSYAASVADAYRQVGIYTGRVLKGEKPADLPVVRPTKFELAINLRTAKALGLTIPPSVLARADDIIQQRGDTQRGSGTPRSSSRRWTSMGSGFR